MADDILVRVEHLKKYFPVMGGILARPVGYVRSVDDISFDVPRGKTFGLVGESGCGKTTTARLVLRLLEPTSGRILFEGRDLAKMGREELRRQRREMQIVFQDPYASLNPRIPVEQIVGEALEVHRIAKGKAKHDRVMELLEMVGLRAEQARRYPHEFSGGQRQRIGVARALALNPKLIVADEPVSALDVSIQSQIINLLEDLQKRLGLTYLFIAHDLSVVRHISDVVGVMYLGKIVELAAEKDLYDSPLHPYSRALLSAVPIPDPLQHRERIVLEGDVPSPVHPPAGCRFHTRCPIAIDRCKAEEPALRDLGGGHQVACHLARGAENTAADSGPPPRPSPAFPAPAST
ncbi:MAG TPA: dipeptide ABC transporter ATP-binding protein [Bacillota bacterium]|jgi:oligopeptide/dipeptide ABC transporter ATP-binding protein